MADSDFQDRIWAALDQHRVCMVTTAAGGEIRTRPMTAHVDREGHRLLFITHRTTGALAAALASPGVSIALSNEDKNFYAAISCAAAESGDRELLRQIWTPLASAWFPLGPEDPDAALLILTPVSAEIWDGPSSGMVVAFKLATARLLGRAPDLGVNTTIDMR
jgi:general stress protein 26